MPQVWAPQMSRVEKLSMAQLRELCAVLKIQPPASYFKLDEARFSHINEIGRGVRIISMPLCLDPHQFHVSPPWCPG